MKKLFTLMLLGLVALTSCSEDEPGIGGAGEGTIKPSITAHAPGGILYFESGADIEKTISITTNQPEESIAIQLENDGDGWCSATLAGNIITVKTLVENETKQEKSLKLNVCAGEGESLVSTSISIVHSTEAVMPEAELSFATTTATIGYAIDATSELAYTTNQNVVTASVAEDASWLKADIENDKIKFTVLEANTSTSQTRSAVVTVTAGEDDNTESVEVTVTQDVAAVTLDFAVKETNIEDLISSTGELAFTSNHATVVAEVDAAAQGWLQATVEDGKVKFTALEANTDSDSRTATVTVTAGEGENTAVASLTVTQNVASTVAAEVNFDVEVATIGNDIETSTAELAFTTNQTVVTAEVDAAAQGWLQATVEDGKVKFTVLEANPSSEITRDGVVTVTAGEAPNTATAILTITQELGAAPALFTVGEVIDGSVVFWVAEDGQSAKVVYAKNGNAAYDKIVWSGSADIADADNYDGVGNTAKFLALSDYSAEAYPCIAFAVGLGEGWYLPGRSELSQLATAYRADKELINNALVSAGGNAIDDTKYYVSSNPNGSSKAWMVKLSNTGHSSYSTSSTARAFVAIKLVTSK